jgi:pterin-4a-carbinolamine dehydratase
MSNGFIKFFFLISLLISALKALNINNNHICENNSSNNEIHTDCNNDELIKDTKEIKILLKDLNTWELKEKKSKGINIHVLYKKIQFENFVSAVEFINKITIIAEKFSHHPDLYLTSYKNLEIILSSHSLGGLTKNDFIIAKSIDDLLLK